MTKTLAWLDQVTIEELDIDPNPTYIRARPEAGVIWIPAYNQWFAITWEACTLIAENKENKFLGGTDPALEHVFGQPCVLSSDGDLHAYLRGMLDPTLRARAVKGYIEDMVRPIAQRQVATLEEGSVTDLMPNYFEPISVRALGDYFGYDVDSDTLRRWFHDLSLGFSNKAVDENGKTLNPEGFAPSDKVSEEIRAITDPILERLRAHPDESGLSHWMHDGMPEGQGRPDEHIYPTLRTVILGGMQDPGHLMGAVMLGLFGQPEQLRSVIADHSLIPKAAQEAMRWATPINASSRRAKEDMELFGASVKAGETIFMHYGSANRDEKVFDHPEVFDINRPPHPHLGFGTGRHACAGSSFAPAVVRIALEELFTRFPGIEKDPDYEIPVRGFFFRGPTEMRARLLTGS